MSSTVPAVSYWMVFGTSMLPIWELKGAIPMGIALGIPFWTVFVLALIGSSIPVPFIIFFIERFIAWMQRSKVRLFNRFAGWLLGKVQKHRKTIDKYGYFGVFLFVALPIPGTGVWTGSLLASLLDLRPGLAIPMVLLGNVVCGCIMLLLSNIFFPGAVF